MKDIDQKFYCSDYYDISVNKYGVKCRTSLRFWENNGWIDKIDPYGWFRLYFRYWLGIISDDDERQFNRRKGIVSGFRGKLVKMIKANMIIIQFRLKLNTFLLHWGYELTEKYFFIDLSN